MNKKISDNEMDWCDKEGLGGRGQGTNSDWVVGEGQACVPAMGKLGGSDSISKSEGEMRPEGQGEKG